MDTRSLRLILAWTCIASGQIEYKLYLYIYRERRVGSLRKSVEMLAFMEVFVSGVAVDKYSQCLANICVACGKVDGYFH